MALQLSQPPADTSYLQIFAEACQDPLVSEVNLFTLNHDMLLENFLRKKGVRVVDGLREASNGDGSRRWDPSVFDVPSCERCVNLFKLHGSINWWRWGPSVGVLQDKVSREHADRDGRFVGAYMPQEPKKPLYEHVLESEGPRILAGTFNKILDYNSEIFLELHHRFHLALQGCKTSVVCGYGFGDKGVNTRIAEWRHRHSNARLLIIDPAESCEIYRKARGSIRREIRALCPNEADVPIPSGPVDHWRTGLEDCSESSGRIVTWERIRAMLQD